MKKRAAKKAAAKRRLPPDLIATRKALALAEKMSDEEIFQIAVRAGIYTKNGRLRKPYRDDENPSDCRPTD